jgi:hypothetical protein
MRWHEWWRIKILAEFSWGNLHERDYLVDLGVDGRIRVKNMYPQGMRWEGVDWIFLTLDRGVWQAVVITVTNIRVSQKFRQFLEQQSKD